MEKKLIEMITADQLLTWLVIAFLVGYFVYKEWPEFKRRITGAAVEKAASAATDKSLSARLTSIEEDIRQIKDKLDRDYGRLNDMERWKRSMEQLASDSLEEREILMEAMLGVLGGLQELGANGPTKEAKSTIQDYINRQAHKVRRGGEHE
ncbi:MAG: hypothetical protein IJG15_01160 [Lachnospiraceae bacterium]|nr:hypothetical protein [Lachnospiraceae bacterium]